MIRQFTVVLATIFFSAFLASPLWAADITSPAGTPEASADLAPSAGGVLSPLSAAEQQELRLQLAKVSLLTETNKLDEAFKLVDKLKAKYPNNPQVLLAEADLNLRIGNRGAGFAALSRARSLDPSNEDILARQRSVLLGQAPFVGAGYNFRRTKEAFENYTKAGGQGALSQSLSLGVDVTNDSFRTRQAVTRVNGTSSKFDGNRERGTITLDKIYDSGNEWAAALYGANNTIGAGAQYSWYDHSGATTLQANYHRPDWDYIQMLIEDGTKDNVRIERKQFFANHWQFTLGGGVNQYNLQHDSDAGRALAWDLNLGYTFPHIFTGKPNDAELGLFYTVDAEYFKGVDKRTVNGASFKPLPLSSYEIHALDAVISKDLTSEIHAEAYAGYAFDRLGNSGPLYGVVVEYAPVKNLGFDVHALRTILGGQRGSERDDQLGGAVKWRW